jgi:hypothetical protein
MSAARSSFVAPNADATDDNLKNLELRSESVARVTQTNRDIKLSSFSQNKMSRAIGRWYCQYFRIDCSVFTPNAYGFSPSI